MKPTYLHKFVELDCLVLIEVDLFDHVPDLVPGHTLSEGFQHLTNLGNCDVAIAISIELCGWMEGEGEGILSDKCMSK